jgi:hypothetical protein
MRKCTDEQVLKIRDLIWNQGKGYNEAVREAGVDRLAWTSITAIARGTAYKRLGGPTGIRRPKKTDEAVQES